MANSKVPPRQDRANTAEHLRHSQRAVLMLYAIMPAVVFLGMAGWVSNRYSLPGLLDTGIVFVFLALLTTSVAGMIYGMWVVGEYGSVIRHLPGGKAKF